MGSLVLPLRGGQSQIHSTEVPRSKVEEVKPPIQPRWVPDRFDLDDYEVDTMHAQPWRLEDIPQTM